jgi:hypothetical protein
MSRLSYRLSKALSDSRRTKWRPSTREEVLAKLLVKRAAAHRAGLKELEASLRQQIRWALPMRKGGEAEVGGLEEEDEPAQDAFDDRL